MKKINLKKGFTIIIVSLVLLTLNSCRKDDNSVGGNITYIGAISGTEYVASGATVYLMVSDTEYTDKTTADENGDYLFYPVPDGDYHIEAEITVDLIDYEGKSSDFYVKGKDDRFVDLVLH